MSSVWTWLALGGPVMAVLAVLSVAVVSLAIIKLWEFSEARIWRREFVEPVLRQVEAGRPDQAAAALATAGGPLAELMREAVALLQRGPVGASAQDRLARRAADRLESLRGLLRPLEVIATWPWANSSARKAAGR